MSDSIIRQVLETQLKTLCSTFTPSLPIPYGGGVMKEEQSSLVTNGEVNVYKSPVKVFRGRPW